MMPTNPCNGCSVAVKDAFSICCKGVIYPGNTPKKTAHDVHVKVIDVFFDQFKSFNKDKAFLSQC